ncbi:MAG: hypothetical protein Q8R86_10825, partial [Sulfuricurvum sp.]|nr:hypothetical protein [Sulfuricurvum sp.]
IKAHNLAIFQKSVINSIKQDESLVALRWAQFQNYISKIDFIKTVKEEKYQDSFLKYFFEKCSTYGIYKFYFKLRKYE